MKTIAVPVELLPCPFCGGPVNLESAGDRVRLAEGRREFWGVVCRNTTNVGGSCCMEQVPSASKEAAIARWNTRAAAPPQSKPAEHCDCHCCVEARLENPNNAAGQDSTVKDKSSVQYGDDPAPAAPNYDETTIKAREHAASDWQSISTEEAACGIDLQGNHRRQNAAGQEPVAKRLVESPSVSNPAPAAPVSTLPLSQLEYLAGTVEALTRQLAEKDREIAAIKGWKVVAETEKLVRKHLEAELAELKARRSK